MDTDILNSLGAQMIAVITPVSICMFLVVVLDFAVSPAAPTGTTATLIYIENSSDRLFDQLVGALLNASAFIVIIGLITFFIAILYYYNCTNCLNYYMQFCVFVTLVSTGGPVFLSIIMRFSIPVDSITCFVLLLNFAVVGALSVSSAGIPICLRQMYMVLTGIIVAAVFMEMPEWTTWVILVSVALYDVVAVLLPCGPLRILMELASSRGEELPGLIYETRPTVSVELRRQPQSGRAETENEIYSNQSTIEMVDEEALPLVGVRRSSANESEEGRPEAEDEILVTQGVQLGLGDFIFYSVLVGRAAMYDLLTAFACYFAITWGLGCTIVLTVVWGGALPALPISIKLGVVFYFLTRLLLEPYVVEVSRNLLMF